MLQNSKKFFMRKGKMKKEFDTVQFFREVKEKIAIETQSMTFDELKAHIKAKN